MTEFYKHIEKNKETFDLWIRTQARLQHSNDIFKPLIPIFEEQTGTMVKSCQDCIIDMLIWCNMMYKNNYFNQKLNETETKIIKKSRTKKVK